MQFAQESAKKVEIELIFRGRRDLRNHPVPHARRDLSTAGQPSSESKQIPPACEQFSRQFFEYLFVHGHSLAKIPGLRKRPVVACDRIVVAFKVLEVDVPRGGKRARWTGPAVGRLWAAIPLLTR